VTGLQYALESQNTRQLSEYGVRLLEEVICVGAKGPSCDEDAAVATPATTTQPCDANTGCSAGTLNISAWSYMCTKDSVNKVVTNMWAAKKDEMCKTCDHSAKLEPIADPTADPCKAKFEYWARHSVFVKELSRPLESDNAGRSWLDYRAGSTLDFHGWLGDWAVGAESDFSKCCNNDHPSTTCTKHLQCIEDKTCDSNASPYLSVTGLQNAIGSAMGYADTGQLSEYGVWLLAEVICVGVGSPNICMFAGAFESGQTTPPLQ